MDENQLTVAEAQPPQQLITIEPAKYVELVFEPFAKRLADAKTLAEAAQFDVTTTAGMAVAVKHRATFREIRVESEKARKIRKAPILEIGKLLDSRQKEIEAEIEPFESRFDDAIKAEEARKEAEKQAKLAAEKARIDGIRQSIDGLRAYPTSAVGRSSTQIAEMIETIEAVEITLESYQEFAGEAEATKLATVHKLWEMFAAQKKHEAEQARIQAEREELARLRAEAEERERIAAAERAEQERVARVAREAEEARLKAEREVHEAKLRAEREEAQRQLDAQRAEIAKQQAEIAAAKAEAERAERERLAAIEREEQRKREEAEAAARAEAARIEAERRAAEQEQIRREREQFANNGPGDVEIVKLLANHYGVTLGDAMQWMKKFDYAAADEYFAAANVAANRLEAA